MNTTSATITNNNAVVAEAAASLEVLVAERDELEALPRRPPMRRRGSRSFCWGRPRGRHLLDAGRAAQRPSGGVLPRRLWLTTTCGPRGRGQAICEALTDEQALERILRGEHLMPVQGERSLIDEIRREIGA